MVCSMWVWFCLLDIMLVLNIMGSPWIDQLNAIFKYFIPKFSLQKLDVSLYVTVLAKRDHLRKNIIVQ